MLGISVNRRRREEDEEAAGVVSVLAVVASSAKDEHEEKAVVGTDTLDMVPICLPVCLTVVGSYCSYWAELLWLRKLGARSDPVK